MASSKLDCKGHGGWRAETVKVTAETVTIIDLEVE